MTSSSRTYTGIILIFFGGSTLFGTRGQHAVNFPLMKQQAPTDTYKRKLPIWLASNSFFNHSLTKGQTALTDYRHGKKETKKRGYPRLDRNILSYLKKRRLPTLPLCRQYHRRERA